MQGRFAAIAAAGFSLLLLASCAQTIRSIAGNMAIEAMQAHSDLRWSSEPIPKSFEDTTQTARVGELLFVQGLQSASEARLVATLVLKTPTPMFQSQRPDLEFAKGAVLLPVEGQTRGHSVYCDPRIGFQDQYQKLRACLIDKETDGVFDDASWALMFDAYAPLLLSYPETSISVPYSREEHAGVPLPSVGAVVSKSGSDTYRLRLTIDRQAPLATVERPKGDSQKPAEGSDLADANTTQFRDKDLPLKLVIEGAQIEILAIKQDQVTYRVLSGVKNNLPIGFTADLLRSETAGN